MYAPMGSLSGEKNTSPQLQDSGSNRECINRIQVFQIRLDETINKINKRLIKGHKVIYFKTDCERLERRDIYINQYITPDITLHPAFQILHYI